MSWLNLQKRFHRKLDFRDVYFTAGVAKLASAAIVAMSEKFKFNLIILERTKADETRNFLEDIAPLDIVGPDVLVYHERPCVLDNVIKVSSRQEFRRAELDFMAFAQRRPFIVISFEPPKLENPDDADTIHLLRLLRFSNNFRGFILSYDEVGQEFAVYA